MTTETAETRDAELTAAIAAAAAADGQPAGTAQRQLVIINWSGQYDKVMPTLIMSSVAAASGYKASVFLTFWGLLPFVKDEQAHHR